MVPPGDLAPEGGDCYRVFTPYWRRWRERAAARARAGAARGRACPARSRTAGCPRSPSSPRGGALARPARAAASRRARARSTRWLARGLERYDELHDDLAADGTSRLSAYLHFGCLSPLEVAERARGRAGAEPFVRQLCWRDFYAQLLARAARHARARTSARAATAGATTRPGWRPGRRAAPAIPIIDAGMRQLAREGFMHNRARLLTASFLTKDLYIDWRAGAAHFFDLLVDGDVANNVGNWQWVAGTGVDTRPNRVFNPITQAKRFDPEGDYVRRYVPELADVEGAAVHEPWKLAQPPRGLSRADPRPPRGRCAAARDPRDSRRMTFLAPAGSSCAPRTSPTRATSSRSTCLRSRAPRGSRRRTSAASSGARSASRRTSTC